jgi:hypothetical protein
MMANSHQVPNNNYLQSDDEQTTSLSPIEQALGLAQEEFLKLKQNQTGLNNSSDIIHTSTSTSTNRNDECHYNYYNTRIELPYEEWIELVPDLNLRNGQLHDAYLRSNCDAEGEMEDNLDTRMSSDLVIDKDNIERVIDIRNRLKSLIFEDLMTGR